MAPLHPEPPRRYKPHSSQSSGPIFHLSFIVAHVSLLHFCFHTSFILPSDFFFVPSCLRGSSPENRKS